LVYSQSGTLYDLVPNAPRPTNDPSIPTPKPHADGTFSSVTTQASSTVTGNKISSTSTPTTVSTVSNSKSPPTPDQTSKVNLAQSSQQFGKKKKNNTTKGKGKKYSSEEEVTKTQEPTAARLKQKKKEKYPCMICTKDHYTKDCPHKDEVTWFLKGNSQPVVLTNPFPPQQ
jgi:hypothetical protein